MRKLYYLIALLLFGAISGQAQDRILFHQNSNTIYQSDVTEVDSIKFSGGNTSVYQGSSITPVNFLSSEIDSITFDNTTVADGEIYIIYNGEEVTIINPFASLGISISNNAGHVTSVSDIAVSGIEYNILGTSSNGSLTLSSNQDVVLALNNLTLTNPAGAAFNISGTMTTILNLENNNSLTDGTSNAAGATLLAADDILVEGNGVLNVKGLKKHAISNKASFVLNSGSVVVTETISDGVHTEVYVQNGGKLTVSASGDGVDAGVSIDVNSGELAITSTTDDVKGIKSGESIIVDGGLLNISVSGNQSKGISTQDFVVNAGEINVTASGATVLEALGSGFDPSYCSGVKTDNSIMINGGTVTVTCPSTNDGGRSFTSDGNITINGGTVTAITNGTGKVYTSETGVADAYSPCGIKADGHIYLLSGNISCTSTGGAGKGISADSTINIGIAGANNSSLIIDVLTSGARFLVSGTGENADYANPKAISADGNLTVYSGTITINGTQTAEGGEGLESKNNLYLKGGDITINTYDDCINAAEYIEISGGNQFLTARGNDAVDSNGEITVSGGFTIANGAGNPEAGFDCDNNPFIVSGGIMIGTGGSTSNPTTNVSTQNSVKITVASGSAISIKNNSGQVVLQFQLPTLTSTGMGGGPGGGQGNSMTVLFSDPALVNGTYTIQYGGTISGGTTENGYNTGGTYSGGSSRSFTVSSRLTTVSL